MIQLFDVYSQESQDLHDSLLAAGFDCPTVIIEPNGFLPDDMISPFTYFLGDAAPQSKPLFFNQVPVSPFWEIVGDHQAAQVLDMGEERARIQYADQALGRIVKQVDWLDKQGQICLTDRYDKYGQRFAQTVYGAEQRALATTYFSAEQEERLVENHVTGDLIVSLKDEPVRFFKNRLAFLHFFFQYAGLDLDHIIFNSLATSFLLSYSLPADSGTDLLFWQEPIYDELPGNMQLILKQNLRTKKIAIADQATYEKALALAGPGEEERFVQLGYHYDFKRDNFLRKDALILTHSDQIEQLEVLIANLPEVTFRIAALTEMSPKLLSILSYKNAVLYQNASPDQIEELFELSDIYLDINYGGQVLHAVRRAFENNLLLLAFEQTAHDRRYIADKHVFDKEAPQAMIEKINQALAGVEGMRNALLAQGRHANDVPAELYRKALGQELGGQHGKG